MKSVLRDDAPPPHTHTERMRLRFGLAHAADPVSRLTTITINRTVFPALKQGFIYDGYRNRSIIQLIHSDSPLNTFLKTFPQLKRKLLNLICHVCTFFRFSTRVTSSPVHNFKIFILFINKFKASQIMVIKLSGLQARAVSGDLRAKCSYH